MKAYTRSEYGSPDVLRLEEVPTLTPQSGEILVRVHAASVNMADVDYLTGRAKIARWITGRRRPRTPVSDSISQVSLKRWVTECLALSQATRSLLT